MAGGQTPRTPGLEPTLAAEAASDATLPAAASQPASRPGADAAGPLPVMHRDRYVVEREIARGGMGRILVARDVHLGRRVAIKALIADRPWLRSRFEREARITARLEHPAIVPVHEAGAWPDGEPFYVMKLVSGRPLSDVVAEAATPAARLALVPHVIAVVDALAYAHSRRVIHRDLKPANVLVGDFGETVVIDWGLAKDLTVAETDDPLAPGDAKVGETLAGAVLGTPAYMAPEQAAGQAVDERGDVYALGALLYHVLAGAPPYDAPSSDEVLARVLAAPPAPLAERAADLPRDLRAIADKAMARRPEDRYRSAGELAEDLKKFQTGQLVGAHRYTSWQLVRRFVRRHRGMVALGAGSLALLATLSVVAFGRIVGERDRALRAEATAESRRGGAVQLLDFLLVDLKQRLEPVGRLDLIEGVASAVLEYDTRVGETPDDVARRRRIRALHIMSDVARDRGDLTTAERLAREALAVGEQLVATGGAEARFALAASRRRVANLTENRGELDAARHEYEAAHAILSELCAGDPEQDDWARELAMTELDLGDLENARGRRDEALVRHDIAVAALRRLVGERGRAERRTDLVGALQRRGDVRFAKGDLAGALADGEEALALAETISAESPGDLNRRRDRVVLLKKIARDKRDLRRVDEALADTRRSCELSSSLTDADPGNATWAKDVVSCHDSLARLHLARKAYDEALREADTAITLQERLVARDPANVAWRADLAKQVRVAAHINDAAGRPAEAMGGERRAIAIHEAIVRDNPDNVPVQHDLARAWEHLGDIYWFEYDTPNATLAWGAALRVRETILARDPHNAEWRLRVAYGAGRVAESLRHTRQREAVRLWRRAIAMLEQLRSEGKLDAAGRKAIDRFRVDVMIPWRFSEDELERDVKAQARKTHKQ